MIVPNMTFTVFVYDLPGEILMEEVLCVCCHNQAFEAKSGHWVLQVDNHQSVVAGRPMHLMSSHFDVLKTRPGKLKTCP